MKKLTLNVPEGVQYISDWKNYELPKGRVIVDKGVTGCGYTEYCLTNDRNIVLCSPRKLLLENKRDQHVKDLNILYLENKIKDFDSFKEFDKRIKDHIDNCLGPFGGAAVKFTVTYDSCFRVVEALDLLGVLQDFTFVVDEFQSIFLDAYFKASTEFDFVDALQNCDNIIYLSATPMLEKYLDQIPEFKDLDYQEIIWGSDVVERVTIQRKQVKYLSNECIDIINSYLKGNFPTKIVGNKLHVSKEAVFYFNSISEIIRVLNKTGLKAKDVNIICADSQTNRTKLRKIKHDIGKIPLKGEINKMFTFCTKAAYIGADFYSDCAKSYVFADPNLDCLAIDISLDLPQIVGRQRTKENVFKNDIVIFYRTLRGENIEDRAQFNIKQNKRKKMSKDLLNGFYSMTPDQQTAYVYKLRSDIQVSQYRRDFISVSKSTNLPVYNDFIELSNERAWEVAQVDYQDSINVTKAIEETGMDPSKKYLNEKESLVQSFLDNKFYSTNIFEKKMKYYCEFLDQHGGDPEIEDIIYYKIKNPKFRTFYQLFGTAGCSASKYREKSLDERVYNMTKESELRQAIYNNFKVGDRLSKKSIKQKLAVIYRDLGVVKNAKATDLKEYFKLVRTTISSNKHQEEGFKLESLI